MGIVVSNHARRALRQILLCAALPASGCLLNPQGEPPDDDAYIASSGGASASGGSATGGAPASGGVPIVVDGGVGGSGGGTGGTGAETSTGGGAGAGEMNLCPSDAGALPPANEALADSSGLIDDRQGTGLIGRWSVEAAAGAVVEPAAGEAVVIADGQACFRGSIAASDPADPSVAWGASIGLSLCEVPAGTTDLAPPLSALEPDTLNAVGDCGLSVSGLSFQLDGQVPPGLRLVLDEVDRESAAAFEVAAGGPFCNVISAASPSDAASPLSPSALAQIRWLVPSTDSAVEFDFCISALGVW